jgi:hypothetical protein
MLFYSHLHNIFFNHILEGGIICILKQQTMHVVGVCLSIIAKIFEIFNCVGNFFKAPRSKSRLRENI